MARTQQGENLLAKVAKESIEFVLSKIWLQQLDTIENSAVSVRIDKDIEQLHLFRVTLRQTRALLKVCRQYLPAEIKYFTDEFKWLAAATGAVRDLDVLLLNVRDQSIYQSEQHSEHLIPVLEAFLHQRKLAHAHLIKIITGTRFKKLLSKWRKFLLVKMAPDMPVKPGVSVRSMVTRLAAQECRRLVKEGYAIEATSSSVELHHMRIRVKRLRYLLINFAYLFDTHKKKFQHLLETLEEFQSVLGSHHDAVKALASLQQVLNSEEGQQFPPATFFCAGCWSNALLSQQQKARDQFADVFRAFNRHIKKHGINDSVR